MVAALIRMRLALQANEMRRSTMLMVGAIINYLFAGFAVLGVIVGGILLGIAGLPVETLVLIQLFGTILVFALWAILPVFLTGVDMTMDPARFAMYPIAPRSLALAVTGSSIVAPAVIMTLSFFVGTALMWLQQPGVLIMLLLLAPVLTATSLATGYSIASWASTLLGKRRGRDITAIIGIVFLMSIGVIINSVSYSLVMIWDEISAIVNVLSWTPLGFSSGAAAEGAAGNWGLAFIKAVLVIVWALVVYVIWIAGIKHAMANITSREVSNAKAARGLGPFNLYPQTPTGAVAARTLVYWMKDPRYSSSLLILPLLPAIMYFSAVISGDGTEFFYYMQLGVTALLGLLMGITIMNDLAGDNTAFSLHILTGVSGRADRTGRVMSLMSFSIPGIILVAIAMAALADAWDVLPISLGLGLGSLFGVAGVSSIVSAWIVYPMAKPNESPFATQKGGFLKSLTATAISFASGAIVLTIPTIFMITYFVTEQSWATWATLASGLIIGLVVLYFGIRIGGSILDKRAPELYQQVLAL